MKARDVLKALGVTRVTLHKYLKMGYIRATLLPSGRYEYDEESINEFLGRKTPRKKKKTVVYTRISSPPRTHLKEQEERLLNFCTAKGLSVDEIYADVRSGVNFERPGLNDMLKELLSGNIGTIVIENRDRLARFGFPLFETICRHHSAEIIVANDISEKNFEHELTDDLIAIINHFSTKSDAARRTLNRIKKELKSEKNAENAAKPE